MVLSSSSTDHGNNTMLDGVLKKSTSNGIPDSLAGGTVGNSAAATNGNRPIQYDTNNGNSLLVSPPSSKTISISSNSEATSTTSSGSIPDWLQEKVEDAIAAPLEDIPRPTENGGYTHTSASKAKISAANKGKVPWNKGKGRSEEVKARIAAGVRKRNREKFLQKLEEMGVTEEEYNAQQAKEKAQKEAERKARRTSNGGYRPTEETKQKISRVLKSKWANGEVKKRVIDPAKVRRGFTHSPETRAKISAALRKRWATDEDYRNNMINKTIAINSNPEIRKRISETLRQKWQDPEFRLNMTLQMAKRKRPSTTRGLSHREKISAAIKAKWQDEAYRRRATEAMARKQAELRKSRPPKLKKPRATKKKTAAMKQMKPKLANSVAEVATAKTTMVSSPAKPKRNDISESAKQMSNGAQLAKPLSEPRPKIKGARQRRAAASNGIEIVSAANKVATKKKIKKKVADADVSLDLNSVESTEVSDMDGVKAKKPETKKKRKAGKRKKQAAGSVSLLREERRDLYDLLYGDDDDEAGDSSITYNQVDSGESVVLAESSIPISSNNRLASIFLEDENLDDFDPYGLDDF